MDSIKYNARARERLEEGDEQSAVGEVLEQVLHLALHIRKQSYLCMIRSSYNKK